MGFGKMPVDCAQILLKNNISIECIIETEKSDFSQLKGFCERSQISFENYSKVETSKFLNTISHSTIIFSINNNYIFPNTIVQKSCLRIINFHNSLLPDYPGHGKVIPTWAIFNGETTHGVTWHLVNANIDAGEILIQEPYKISNKDTALTVMMQGITLGTTLFSKNWQNFLAENIKSYPQPHKTCRMYRSNELPNDGYINIDWDFTVLSCFLRSLDYGFFKLLLPAKINYETINYSVLKYDIIEKINSDKENIMYNFSSPKILDTIEFHYEQGSIIIFVHKED